MGKAWKTDDGQENTLVVENAETPEEAANPAPKGETAKTPKEAENLAEKVIYVGPSIRGTRLHTFAVFSDGIPAEYREHPTLKHLFVAPDMCYKRASEEMKSKEAE